MKKFNFLGLVSVLSVTVSILTASSALADGPGASAASEITRWGGRGVSLQVDHQEKVAHFQFDCAGGTASHWVRVLSSPRFKMFIAKGTVTHFSGVVQVGHLPKPVPAVYEAVIDDNEMKLSVRSDGLNQKFELRKGAQGEIRYCE